MKMILQGKEMEEGIEEVKVTLKRNMQIKIEKMIKRYLKGSLINLMWQKKEVLQLIKINL